MELKEGSTELVEPNNEVVYKNPFNGIERRARAFLTTSLASLSRNPFNGIER